MPICLPDVAVRRSQDAALWPCRPTPTQPQQNGKSSSYSHVVSPTTTTKTWGWNAFDNFSHLPAQFGFGQNIELAKLELRKICFRLHVCSMSMCKVWKIYIKKICVRVQSFAARPWHTTCNHKSDDIYLWWWVTLYCSLSVPILSVNPEFIHW